MWRVDPQAAERQRLEDARRRQAQPLEPAQPPVSNSRKLAFLAAFCLLGLVALVVWYAGSSGIAGVLALVGTSAVLLRYSFTGERPRRRWILAGWLAIFVLLIIHLVLTI